MKQWNEIRHRILVDGQSKRSIQKAYQLHWDTLKKILKYPDPPGYRMSAPRRKRVLEPYIGMIDEILSDDRKFRRKQRHTAKRIFERLRDEHGYCGGLTVVKDYVRSWHLGGKEVFVPLQHRPGEAQVDFGEADIIVDGAVLTVALFVMTLPYCDAIFCCVFPRECSESFLEGHRRAFEFFNGVPWRITYDNMKIAVKRVMLARDRELTDAFLRLQSHYLFAHHFCLVRRPNEKGHVENLLGFARRNFLVPLPQLTIDPHDDPFETLNTKLAADCLGDMQRTLRGRHGTKAQLLAEERAGGGFLTLPHESFETRRVVTAKVNSLSLVRFDTNDYSVPTAYAHHEVTVVGSIGQVRILFPGIADQVVATHKRHWGKQHVTFDPVHYLALLERKPGALDFASPLANWCLPGCFMLLRRRLESEFASQGTRQFIRVLRLLESVTIKQLAGAIEYALSINIIDYDALKLIVQHRRERPVGLFNLDGRPHLQAVQVQAPDLLAYRVLTEAMSYASASGDIKGGGR